MLKGSLALSGPSVGLLWEDAVMMYFVVWPFSIPSGVLQLLILGTGNPVTCK